jgi:hypothetical protein
MNSFAIIYRFSSIPFRKIRSSPTLFAPAILSFSSIPFRKIRSLPTLFAPAILSLGFEYSIVMKIFETLTFTQKVYIIPVYTFGLHLYVVLDGLEQTLEFPEVMYCKRGIPIEVISNAHKTPPAPPRIIADNEYTRNCEVSALIQLFMLFHANSPSISSGKNTNTGILPFKAVFIDSFENLVVSRIPIVGFGFAKLNMNINR